MLRKISCMFFCGPRESFYQSTKEGVGMVNEVERNTRSSGKISDEFA